MLIAAGVMPKILTAYVRRCATSSLSRLSPQTIETVPLIIGNFGSITILLAGSKRQRNMVYSLKTISLPFKESLIRWNLSR